MIGTRGHCARAAFLVDGEKYFKAIAEAVRQARQSVLIVGWDIDSRIRLERSPAGPTLLELLNEVVEERPEVDVHILIWDYPLAYSMDREPLQMISFLHKSHPNVHFHLDSDFPMGSSHHQKVVVVDDAVAFVGGMDLTAGRWDTPEHEAGDDRRTAPDGKQYTPYHDVQMVVDGEIATILGGMARERWQWATGESLPAPGTTDGSPWPRSVDPDLTDITVNMVVTLPKYKEREEIQDIEAMYLRAIATAQSLVYIENQYFTSQSIQRALGERLEDPDGPEVVIILPHTPTGLLERLVMEPLQSEVLDALHKADKHGRLGVYCPFSGEDREIPIKVHAKVMVVDDSFVTVGSANLNNRSMGLDTECNLALNFPDAVDTVSRFRRHLAGHLLGVSVQDFEDAESSEGSLLNAVESIRSETGGLRMEMDTRTAPPIPVSADIARPLDPSRPGVFDAVMDGFADNDNSQRSYAGFVKLGMLLAVFAAMALAWRYTPLSQYANIDVLLGGTHHVSRLPLAPALAVGAFLLGGLVMFPVIVLIVLSAAVFDPFMAFGVSLAGCLGSALLVFGIGYVLGRDAVEKLSGPRISVISRQIGKHGLLSIIVTRVIPVAPFTIINLVAGASRINVGKFVVGTILGMTPGIVGMTLFGSQLVSVLQRPGPVAIGVLALIVIVVIVLGALLQRRLRVMGKSLGGEGKSKDGAA